MQLRWMDIPDGIAKFFQPREIRKELALAAFGQVVQKILIFRPVGLCQQQMVVLHMGVHKLPHHVDPRVMPPRFPVLLDHVHIAGNMFFQPCVQFLGRGCNQLIEQILFIPAVAVNSRRRQAAALSDGAHGGLLKPIFEKLLPRGGHESDVIYGLIPWHKSAPSKLLAYANYMLTQFAYLVKPCFLTVLLQLHLTGILPFPERKDFRNSLLWEARKSFFRFMQVRCR